MQSVSFRECIFPCRMFVFEVRDTTCHNVSFRWADGVVDCIVSCRVAQAFPKEVGDEDLKGGEGKERDGTEGKGRKRERKV